MLFFLAQDAVPSATPAGPTGITALIIQLFPFLMIAVVFWFLLIRPQKKQEAERKARVDALKRGDRVRTRGGIVAHVLRVKDDEVILGIGGDRSVELPVHKAFVDEVYGDGKPDAGKTQGK